MPKLSFEAQKDQLVQHVRREFVLARQEAQFETIIAIATGLHALAKQGDTHAREARDQLFETFHIRFFDNTTDVAALDNASKDERIDGFFARLEVDAKYMAEKRGDFFYALAPNIDVSDIENISMSWMDEEIKKDPTPHITDSERVRAQKEIYRILQLPKTPENDEELTTAIFEYQIARADEIFQGINSDLADKIYSGYKKDPTLLSELDSNVLAFLATIRATAENLSTLKNADVLMNMAVTQFNELNANGEDKESNLLTAMFKQIPIRKHAKGMVLPDLKLLQRAAKTLTEVSVLPISHADGPTQEQPEKISTPIAEFEKMAHIIENGDFLDKIGGLKKMISAIDKFSDPHPDAIISDDIFEIMHSTAQNEVIKNTFGFAKDIHLALKTLNEDGPIPPRMQGALAQSEQLIAQISAIEAQFASLQTLHECSRGAWVESKKLLATEQKRHSDLLAALDNENVSYVKKLSEATKEGAHSKELDDILNQRDKERQKSQEKYTNAFNQVMNAQEETREAANSSYQNTVKELEQTKKARRKELAIAIKDAQQPVVEGLFDRLAGAVQELTMTEAEVNAILEQTTDTQTTQRIADIETNFNQSKAMAQQLLNKQLRQADEQPNAELARILVVHQEELRAIEQAREQAEDAVMENAQGEIKALKQAHDERVAVLESSIGEHDKIVRDTNDAVKNASAVYFKEVERYREQKFTAYTEALQMFADISKLKDSRDPRCAQFAGMVEWSKREIDILDKALKVTESMFSHVAKMSSEYRGPFRALEKRQQELNAREIPLTGKEKGFVDKIKDNLIDFGAKALCETMLAEKRAYFQNYARNLDATLKHNTAHQEHRAATPKPRTNASNKKSVWQSFTGFWRSVGQKLGLVSKIKPRKTMKQKIAKRPAPVQATAEANVNPEENTEPHRNRRRNR